MRLTVNNRVSRPCCIGPIRKTFFFPGGLDFVLNGETIRDLALHAGGLLSLKIGGPSVYPPQPQTVYSGAYGSPQWPESDGSARYRRSLYTFSKRTAPFAAYAVFDAPTGENCIVQRDRSNTPLQALTLLNDEMFLEAARAAVQTTFTPGQSPVETATSLFRQFLTRPPREQELSPLLQFQQAQRKRSEAGELDAAEITQTDDASAEQAAWVMTARVILNLDETVTKP